MTRTPVVSSNVVSVGYDAASKTLEVEFNGGAVYQYFGVPSSVHQGLLNADSVGSYFSAHVKFSYKYKKTKGGK